MDAENREGSAAQLDAEVKSEERGSSDSEASSYVMMDKEEIHSQTGSGEVTEEEIAAIVKEPEEEDHQEKCHLINEQKENEVPPEDDWIFVLGHEKLKKKIVTRGGGTRPVNGEIVTVSCVGRLSDREVDCHDSLRFTLGDGDVIQAFDLCIALAEEGETFELYTDAQYAYGSAGKLPDIPPNSTITYTVNVLKVEPPINFATLSVAERVSFAGQKRERGNELYTREEYISAINSYTKAVKIVDDSAESHSEAPEQLQKLVEMRVKCFNNLTAAQLKIEAYDAAIKSADEVLRIETENVKALYRKGKCLAGKGENESAISCLRRALKLEPESKIIHSELSKLTRKFKKEEESQKAMYQRMLGTDKKPFLEPKQKGSNKWLYAGAASLVAVCAVGAAIAVNKMS